MKTLQIVETAYRATLEEQDDPILWLTAAMRNAGAELAVLLTGNAVNYAVAAQQPVALQIGAWRQKQPPNPAADVSALAAKGVEMFVLAEDLELRGIGGGALVPQVTPVPRAQLPALIARFARVWRW
jgi:sulfur transfer complex TusBCD TusB component (DsrH family)